MFRLDAGRSPFPSVNLYSLSYFASNFYIFSGLHNFNVRIFYLHIKIGIYVWPCNSKLTVGKADSIFQASMGNH